MDKRAINSGIAIFGTALARFEARIRFADDVDAAATAHHLAVAVASLGVFERREDFHEGSFRRCVVNRIGS